MNKPMKKYRVHWYVLPTLISYRFSDVAEVEAMDYDAAVAKCKILVAEAMLIPFTSVLVKSVSIEKEKAS